MQLKREAKLLTVIGLNTKHADCRIIFMLYSIRIRHTYAFSIVKVSFQVNDIIPKFVSVRQELH